jgi:hypothetical protein
MIGQYLPNNNEKSYSAVLQNFLSLNRPSARFCLAFCQLHFLKRVESYRFAVLQIHAYLSFWASSESRPPLQWHRGNALSQFQKKRAVFFSSFFYP